MLMVLNKLPNAYCISSLFQYAAVGSAMDVNNNIHGAANAILKCHFINNGIF